MAKGRFSASDRVIAFPKPAPAYRRHRRAYLPDNATPPPNVTRLYPRPTRHLDYTSTSVLLGAITSVLTDEQFQGLIAKLQKQREGLDRSDPHSLAALAAIDLACEGGYVSWR